MGCSKVLSFAEIVRGRDASVRVTDDNMLFAVDLVMVMTGASRDDAGKALRRLSNGLFSSDKLSERNTGGSGNTKTKLVSFEDGMELVMVLPGKIAKETRAMFANILKRYLAGDESLIVEIPNFERDPLRHNLDERTRLMMQDSLQNSILNTAFTTGLKKAITNGPSASKPISIASVASELGFRPTTEDAKRIGLDLRKRYLKQHGKPPPKHDQLCDGRVTLVNSYTEQDRPLVEEALHAYFKPCEESDGDSE